MIINLIKNFFSTLISGHFQEQMSGADFLLVSDIIIRLNVPLSVQYSVQITEDI